MIQPADLQWGQTPFDNLTHAELLRLVQAYHSAVRSLIGTVEVLRHGTDQESPFWKPGGSGHRGVAKADALLALTDREQDGGQQEASTFFRYTDNLFFPGVGFEQWTIYPDGSVRSPGLEPGGRPLTWNDMLPKS